MTLLLCDVVYLATFFDKASSLRLGIWQPLFGRHYLYGEGFFFVLRTSYTHQGRPLVVCSLLQQEIATFNAFLVCRATWLTMAWLSLYATLLSL